MILQKKLKLAWLLTRRVLARVDKFEWAMAFFSSLVVIYVIAGESHHWAAYPVFYICLLLMFAPIQHLKLLRPVYQLLWVPAFVVLIVAPIYLPLATWLLSQILVVGGTFMLIELILKFFGHGSNLNLLLYFGLTLSAILLTTIGNRFYRIYPFNKFNKEYIEVGMKLHSQKRTKIYIYAMYFLILITSMVNKLTDKSLFPNVVLGEIYIQSFATYLAFDRIQNAVKEISVYAKIRELWKEYIAVVGLKNRRKMH